MLTCSPSSAQSSYLQPAQITRGGLKGNKKALTNLRGRKDIKLQVSFHEIQAYLHVPPYQGAKLHPEATALMQARLSSALCRIPPALLVLSAFGSLRN